MKEKEEFNKFMKEKVRKQNEKISVCEHIWYDSIIIDSKKYIYEILKDKRWKTKLYNIKQVIKIKNQ